MVDYTQFNETEKDKEKEYKFLYLGDNETSVFIFIGIKAGVRQNPWSGDQEEVWFVKLEDDEGNEKSWTISALATYRQFKEQNIQEEDLIRITKSVKGNRTKYIVEKMKTAEEKVSPEIKDEDIPTVE